VEISENDKMAKNRVIMVIKKIKMEKKPSKISMIEISVMVDGKISNPPQKDP